MLRGFAAGGGSIVVAAASCDQLPREVVWIDLLSPSREEELLVERCLGLSVPTDEDMEDIEPSSRLYEDHGALYLTAGIVCGVEEGAPKTVPVTFVLTADRLVTVRYADTKAFRDFLLGLTRQPQLTRSAPATLVFLLDSFVERSADLLKAVGRDLDALKANVFRSDRGTARSRISNNVLEETMFAIGRAEATLSKVRESLASLTRLQSYLLFALPRFAPAEVAHLKTVARDVGSLTDMAGFLSGNITFLLDAALGLINIQQNAIIKIFSVAAVIFLPPTLVGTVYGMNFETMPELRWQLGYPFALALMALSAVLPYVLFKRKGWL